MPNTITVTFKAPTAKARNAAMIYGAPSPMTYAGFIEALGYRMASPIEPRFMAMVHDFQPIGVEQGGRTAYDLDRGTELICNGQTQIDNPRAALQASVVFTAPTDWSQAALERQLEDMRFAGSMLEEFAVGIADGESWQEGIRFALSRKGGGFLVHDHAFNQQPSAGDRIEALVEQLGQREAGWVQPSLVGYKLAHRPVPQPGMRREADAHAYAEPLIGIVRYASARRMLGAEAQLLPIWHRRVQGQGRVIRMRADA